MRFRKTRSYLSAFSNDELSDRKQERVREQLAGSEALRREEAIYRSIRDGCRELPKETVSGDFNSKLLDRIAHERFAETRTKAFLPRTSVPRAWGRMIPALATVALLLVAGVNYLVLPGYMSQAIQGTAQTGLSDAHMTAQPDHNPNLAPGFRKKSLPQLVATVDRADEISNMLTGSGMFTNVSSGVSNWMADGNVSRAPFIVHYYRIVPVPRVSQPYSDKLEDNVY